MTFSRAWHRSRNVFPCLSLFACVLLHDLTRKINRKNVVSYNEAYEVERESAGISEQESVHISSFFKTYIYFSIVIQILFFN